MDSKHYRLVYDLREKQYLCLSPENWSFVMGVWSSRFEMYPHVNGTQELISRFRNYLSEQFNDEQVENLEFIWNMWKANQNQ